MSRSPLLRIYDHELITDNFAGGGGASEGIRLALGRDPDIAVNHDPEALAMHRANHPGTHHMEGSVWDVDPRLLLRGRQVGLAWFSPDCFPAGTLVLTRAGYRPIETVAVGDEVLTHKQRWRRVTATMVSRKPLVRLRGHGHPGLLVSTEHPFYARQVTLRGGASGRRLAESAQPGWVPARDLGRGSYWAAPSEFPSAEVPPPPTIGNRSFTVTTDLMWLAGRYVADGWTRIDDTRAELVLTIGHHKVDHVREKLAVWSRASDRAGADELAWHERDTATAHQFSTNSRGIVMWLREQFGHRAEGKSIPAWVLGASRDFREAFLAGYLSGDGCVHAGAGTPITTATSVSKALIFGLRALVATFGHAAQVNYNENQSNVIEGRTVNVRPAWTICWRANRDPKHAQTFAAGGLLWSAVKEREDDAGEAEVYNLSVEEDESYVADGVISHNCTFHSRARGGKPFRDPKSAKGRRGLAWVVTRWARAVRPRCIAVENVVELESWGPLTADGRPDPEREGITFRRWVGHLRNLGYSVEWRELRACDYGAPTSRKRLFIIARCDGHPIQWPEPTHGPGRAQPYRTAAECIDWSLPVPSIFERGKPLADATLARIVRGIMKFVVEDPNPFLVKFYGTSSVQSVDDPLGTITANGLHYAVTTPYLVPLTHQGDARVYPLGEPFRTVTGANRGEVAIAVPTLIQTGYGEREGQAPRALNIHAPLGTAVAGGVKHAFGAVFLARHYGGNYTGAGVELTRPLPTITTIDHHAVVTAAIAKRGDHAAEVRALLERFAPTMRGVKQGDLFAAQRPPLGTVRIGGETFQIVDIGMRMLSPRELFNAQGFRSDYIIDPEYDGAPLSKTSQVRMCGNSVPPQMAAALARANLGAAMEMAA